MYDKTKTNPTARFMLLILAFACAAVTVYSLRDLPAPARYILTPSDAGQVSFLAPLLSRAGIPQAEDMLHAASGIAWEMALWFLGGLTVCAGPVFFLTSAFRGACFGFVLSLAVGNSASVLAGWNLLPVIGWLAVTVLLFCFAANTAGKSFIRCLLQFLPTAGAAFWITFLCSTITI